MRLPAPLLLLLLTLALAAAAVCALSFGALPIAPHSLLAAIGLGDAPLQGYERAAVLDIRLPRLLLAIAIGAASAVAGAAMQGLLRNPLADPSLLGVSGGAALAAAAWLALRQPLQLEIWLPHTYALPLIASLGGLLAAAAVLRLAQFDGVTSVATMLLAGISINALAGAGVGLFQNLADDAALRDISAWMFGSLGRAGWPELAVGLPLLALPTLLLPREARALDALLLGEAPAQHLGVDVQACKRRILLLVVIATATGVAVAGVIGFIGLVVPHLIRLLVGPGHRLLLPASALLGAVLLTLADLAARSAFAPLELPVGVLTALLGAPFFLWLLHASRRRMAVA